MGFKSYAIHSDINHSDGRLILDDPQPLVFSGRHGLVARFIATAGERARGPWKLCPGELHALAMVDRLVRDRIIVFEQTEENVLELQTLEAVHGISSHRTEMMFSLSPLTVVHAAAPLVVRAAATGRSYGEELALDGGIDAPQASWRWTRPHLAIGGVVLQPALQPVSA